MCGIAGLLHFDAARRVDPALLDRMTDALAHRGPDGRGTHLDGPLGLGHRRLAVIDLSQAAAQPLADEEGSLWLVCNGEVYNFAPLREELQARGHRFRSQSDNEVILHLYQEHGTDLLAHLRGMFAFALWDGRARRLLLARDRFGQKPLYYHLTETCLRFASEIKGILEDPAVPRSLDLEAVDDFLAFGYVPGSATAFTGIRRLPPGHLLTVEADGRSRLSRYWSFPTSSSPRSGTPPARRRLVDDLLACLDEACRLRLAADVPVGAFLSGGLDSSAVVSSMVQGRSEPVETFSIGFREEGWDETAPARRVATHCGTRHHTELLGPESFGELDRIVWHHDQPFADPSCLPTFAVSRLARTRVTVALTGDGGDELLCGYDRYGASAWADQLDRLPRPVHRLLQSRALTSALQLAARTGGAARLEQLARRLAWARDTADGSAVDRYLTQTALFNPALRDELYSAGALGLLRGRRDPRDRMRAAIAAAPDATPCERYARADAGQYLPDDILVKVDVASMAHGLECRAPFLDHVLAERLVALPFELKRDGAETKVALRQALARARRVPKEVLKRPKKGFAVPLSPWFRGPLAGTVMDVLFDRSGLERGLFEPRVVRRLVADHLSSRADRSRELFALMILERWQRVFLEASPPSVAPRPTG